MNDEIDNHPLPVRDVEPTINNKTERELFAESIVKSVAAGALAAVVLYAVYAISFEALIMPRLIVPGQEIHTYGQLAGMIIMPLTALIGAGSGLAYALIRNHFIFVGVTLGILGSLFIAMIVRSLWQFNYSQYGAELSDWVLFVPLLVASGGVFMVSLLVGLYATTSFFGKARD